ncbi:DNA-3-methyladenine glycosylase family protein [Metabacillus niabensis]|uniref:DNA-3-methyladenine glycosylase family protein n=1 Tax=Metabacillus niabensis TaxID=324854 RepID=UPI001CF95597|nr:DNA-3-methyladenine glycosylase [Metabacillus niabensis]
MWMEIIRCKGPYNFDSVLDRLSMDPIISLSKSEKTINVPLHIEDMPHVITVKAIGTIDKPVFEVSGKDEKVKKAALKRINSIFRWDFSLEDVAIHFQKTNIAKIFEQHKGTPIVLEFDLYNCLVKCIIHQQLNLAFAHTLTTRFVKRYGYEGEGVWFYPKPEVVAGLQYDELRELQFSRRKAEYLIDTSKLIVEGIVNFDELAQQSDEEIMKSLIKVRGIGPWTVQSLLLSGLGRPNLFPKADIGIQRAIQKHFNLEKKPSHDEMDQYSEQWSPYLSYATLYLWRSIE